MKSSHHVRREETVMLLSLHADTDRTDPRRWRVGAHRHTSWETGGIPPQHLHAAQRCRRDVARPHRVGGRRSCVGAGFARHSRPLARLHVATDVASTVACCTSLRPGRDQVPDGVLVRSLRSPSQKDGRQQGVSTVGARGAERHADGNPCHHRGPHDIGEEIKPVHAERNQSGTMAALERAVVGEDINNESVSAARGVVAQDHFGGDFVLLHGCDSTRRAP